MEDVEWQPRRQNHKACTMICSVLVDAISPEVEEEVSIVVCGQRLTCFASYLPYRLEVGGMYQAELLPMVFDEYIVQEISHAEPAVVREGSGYSCRIIGELRDGCLRCGGLTFCDEILLADFGFLEGKLISWKIDRLDISFV
ncbi:hypothetical protein ACFZAI_01515 [Achromobacter sp. NPDC008082]|uniref:hypothetical protein n=1 Tax=Achromobacter sp. NPDC008082 TaxID=3363888 RepID=UPI0036ED8DF5